MQCPALMTRETQEVILAFLDRNQHTRLGSPQPGEAAAQGVARIKRHPYFAPIPFERLLAGEHPPPFECDFPAPNLEPQRPLTRETNCLDYFCQMVDYLKTSMQMRDTWALTDDDQHAFDDFDFVSTQVLEGELFGLGQRATGP